ncbi:MAG: hypothetical protein DLM73_01775 [Chthoniobacterales bacterium]|nr:MAG: hypothetical protein DLM73_01775 [Chthoniobacterales bacterium]
MLAPEPLPIRLKPCEINEPKTSGPFGALEAVFRAMMVLRALLVPPVMPPPSTLAVLLEIVLLVRFSAFELRMPAPWAAELPLMVLLVTFAVPALAMPPAPELLPLAVLPEIVLLMTFNTVLTLALVMPAPLPLNPELMLAKLPEMAQAVTVKLALLRMPPPLVPSAMFPLEIVRPESVTLKLPAPKPLPGVMLKMRKADAAGSRRTVNRFAPGPLIVMALLIANSPLVRLIGLLTLEAKVMVLPAQTLAITSRNEPGAASLLLLTTRLIVLQPGSWSACTS